MMRLKNDRMQYSPGSMQENPSSTNLLNELRCEKTGLRGFPTRSDTNWAVQLQMMAGGLKFPI